MTTQKPAIDGGSGLSARLTAAARRLVPGTDALSAAVLGGTAGVSAVRVIAQFVGLVSGVILARGLGTRGFGTYEYVASWVGVLAIFAQSGAERLLIREVAVFELQQQWGRLRGALRWSNRLVLASSLAVAALVGLYALVFGATLGTPMRNALWVAAFLVPPMALTGVRTAVLRGLRKVVLGQATDLLLHPVLFLALVAGGFVWWRPAMSPAVVLALQGVAAVAVLIVGQRLLRKRVPPQVWDAACESDGSVWMRSAVALLGLNLLLVVGKRLEVLLLGVMRDKAEVGVYSVALTWSAMIPYVLVAVNAVWSPEMARLHAAGDHERLERLLVRGTRWVFAFGVAIAAVILALHPWLLGLYGADFVLGAAPLAILAAGQLAFVAAGPAAQLLVMTGHERFVTLSAATSLVVGTALDLVLIPRWGMVGAATGATAALVVANSAMAFWVHRKLGIGATIFGRLRGR